MKTKRTMCAVIAIAMVALCTSCVREKSTYTDDIEVYEFEFEGHTYLEFEGCGIVHDPDCECQTNKNDEL